MMPFLEKYLPEHYKRPPYAWPAKHLETIIVAFG
jgi:hypothetical protein